MKHTKWSTYQFTPNEEKARKSWRAAQKIRSELREALRSTICGDGRAAAHIRLDRCFDRIEAIEARAREAFPEVEDSFTIATDTFRF